MNTAWLTSWKTSKWQNLRNSLAKNTEKPSPGVTDNASDTHFRDVCIKKWKSCKPLCHKRLRPPFEMVRLGGLEPPTHGLGIHCSIPWATGACIFYWWYYNWIIVDNQEMQLAVTAKNNGHVSIVEGDTPSTMRQDWTPILISPFIFLWAMSWSAWSRWTAQHLLSGCGLPLHFSGWWSGKCHANFPPWKRCPDEQERRVHLFPRLGR